MLMTKTIIGLAGPIGSGKTEAARALQAVGFARVRFADPLKAMLRCLGLDEVMTDGSLKEAPTPLLEGKTPRFAMQTLGTEWGRELIGRSLWVNAWKRKALAYGTASIVADDVRFEEEVRLIQSLGGTVVFVERPGHATMSNHVSERFAFTPDQTWRNEGSIEEWRDKAIRFGNLLREKRTIA